MSEKEMLERLKKCVTEMDEDGAKAAANDAIAQKLDPLACIEGGLSAGMKVISDKFDNAEIYVPQIILSAEAFTAAVEILSAQIQGGYAGKGKIIIHTVEGDIHDIGKNIVGILLQANGFEVIDLGRDVAINDVVDAAVEKDVDVIAGSALMTTTMPAQREIITELKDRGIKDKFKCLFGGAPTSQEWADQIGARRIVDSRESLAHLGPHLHPTKLLLETARRGGRFYDRATDAIPAAVSLWGDVVDDPGGRGQRLIAGGIGPRNHGEELGR